MLDKIIELRCGRTLSIYTVKPLTCLPLTCLACLVRLWFTSTYNLRVKWWVLVNSTGKIFNNWIRDLDSISIYTKNRLVSWSDNKELSLVRTDVINPLKKKR